MSSSKVVTAVEKLGFPFNTPDPFLFCVYHVDHYPAGDDQMRAPKQGNGADFDFNAPYRMYHGDRVPGFPQHPHRGFETITVTLQGMIDHCDSLGNGGRYGNGDNQWMTAGKGIVHGEMFPLINKDKPNTARLFQIWLNLPARNKLAEPAFVMHWSEQIPKVKGEGGAVATVFAGRVGGAAGLPPPPSSWASDPANEVAVLLITLPPGGAFTFPAAAGATVARHCYFVEGSSLTVSGAAVPASTHATLDAGADAVFANPGPAGSGPTEVLVLQGRPIGEPVAQHGPFVMNTRQEIAQAFTDYQRTRFGGWPWPSDAHVFPRDKGRFAIVGGKEMYPPSAPADPAAACPAK